MAQALEIPDVEPAGRFGTAAARVVGVRAHELFEQSREVLDTSEIERVHDMRVATRRLRAVLEIFGECFPAKAHARVLKDVKALADALGERRDPDVQIEALAGHLGAIAPEDHRGVERLIARQRDRQAAGNTRLAAALRDVEESDLSGRIQALVEAAL